MNNMGYEKSLADMGFALAIAFLALAALLLLIINPPQKLNDTDPKAQGNIIVELAWPDTIDADIDLWVRGEADMIAVGYSNKGGPLFNLLRDDLGSINDLSNKNEEIIYSRGVPDGEYVINAHLFNNKGYKDPIPIRLIVSLKETDKSRTVQLFAVNAELEFYGQELTIARFVLYDRKYIADSFNTIQENIRAAGE